MRRFRAGALALVPCVAALTVTACGSSGGSGATKNPTGPVTLTWWHNGTTDPLKTVWADVATEFHKAHPNVTIKVQPIQNEQFQTKMPLALRSDNPPDVFQQWGGGNQATQVRSGKVMDITQAASGWLKDLGAGAQGWQTNGRQYGVPYDLHVVGFWYRKDLFAKAGIASPPQTMDELDADVSRLKAKGITPMAIGSKDRWPDAFWWEYFAVRECPSETLKQANANIDFSDPCFVKAGNDLTSFLATKPFQTGFLGTPAQEGSSSSAGLVANGKAAMELQGDWEPGVMVALTDDKQFKSKLGWFPFPSVPGGKGQPGVALGGGDGFSCSTKATSACVDFLKYIVSPAVQTKLVKSGVALLPANKQAASAVTDPVVKVVQAYQQQAPYIQTYFDIAMPQAPGQALDDAIANFFAKPGSPDAIPSAVK